MKKSVLAIALLASASAQAMDLEIGTGRTKYKTTHDGLWYQEQYPHSLDLNSVPMSLGISEEYRGIRYRAEYLYLGWVYSSASWVSDADYYAGTSAVPTMHGFGRGSVSGLVLSASRPVPILGLPFYAEAGAWCYVPKWKMTVTNIATGITGEGETERAWKIGPTLGVGLRYSGIDISIKYLGMQQDGAKLPPIYDHAYILETKVYF